MVAPPLLAACGGAPDGESWADDSPENVGASEQGLTCVTIQRTSPASSGVQDAPIITDPTDPTKANTNYGAVAQMNTGYVAIDYRRILMRFDLAVVPAGATIDSATLTLRMIQSPGKADVPLHRVTAFWSESTVTWNQIGNSFDPAVVATLVTLGVPNNSPVSLDVTSLVSAWHGGALPNDGLLLDHPSPGRTVIGSSEAPTTGPRPKLQVCYAPANPCSVVCAAMDACHVAGTCDPATGQCSSPPAPDGTPCQDANVCTESDVCMGGVCLGDPLAYGLCGGRSAAALVSGGTFARSASYAAVLSLGESPGGNGSMSSPNYRFTGGVIGASQGP